MSATQAPASDPIIQVNDFVVKFGTTRLIDGLSFTANRGETFGFLGSNGFGKTTTIRALLGIYTPPRTSCSLMASEWLLCTA